ncbi:MULTISPECIES: hypothetical protein [unclassified Pseudoxanthomonas]|uniref:hypothetical protein n=1 Tax=unclassified Pseudoxanthomonas TaxID=2645906 RepID=UPI00307771CA
MTIVVALKVGDGLVLGADSASTLFTGTDYHNSYFNTEKLIRVDGLPVGALTFGLGALKNRSVSSLANDLKIRIQSEDPDWKIDSANYKIDDVVDRFKRYYYDDLYLAEFGAAKVGPDDDLGAVMGFFVGGFASGSDSSEVWRILLTQRGCDVTKLIAADTPWDCVWEGAREPIQRILWGYSDQILQRLLDAGVQQDVADQLLASMEPLINGAMPIQDAVDFVDYLIGVTCGYVRFAPGHMTVAKPIDLAAITKYNGFKWITRKLYYPAALNMGAPK